MTAVPYAAARVTAGTVGADHVLTSARGTAFVAGQPLWLSLFLEATRASGTETTTLRRALKWYDDADSLLSETYDETVIDASVGPTFLEAKHVAPTGAVSVEAVFTLTPQSSPIQHTVDLSRIRLGRTQVAADVTSVVEGPSTADFRFTYAGAAEDGQFPRNLQFQLIELGVAVTTGLTWTMKVKSGTVNGLTSADSPAAMSGSGTGTLEVTSLSTDTAEVEISATPAGGSARKKTVQMKKVTGTAPSTGSGGGSSASDSTFLPVNSSSMAAISDELTVTVGSGGTVTLSAPLSVTTGAAAPTSSGLEVLGRWQWWNGSAWTDLGAGETASDPDCVVSFEEGSYVVDPGALSVSATKTGLTASSSQKFRLRARNASGTRAMYFSGTASAVAS